VKPHKLKSSVMDGEYAAAHARRLFEEWRNPGLKRLCRVTFRAWEDCLRIVVTGFTNQPGDAGKESARASVPLSVFGRGSWQQQLDILKSTIGACALHVIAAIHERALDSADLCQVLPEEWQARAA
jgi:hypothetical protein